MSEYIEREKALNCIYELIKERLSDARAEIEGLNAAMCGIEDIDSADVQPVRHGSWFISIGNKDGEVFGTICPICGFAWSEAIDAVKLEPGLSLIETPYCPNCGAKMDGV